VAVANRRPDTGALRGSPCQPRGLSFASASMPVMFQ
jgi:hypothetical protein